MLILFDKNAPYQLRRFLVGHKVRTGAEQGWARLVNGELLRVAEVSAKPEEPPTSAATA